MRPWRALAGAWSLLGPGVLLAATSVGASHLVLSPRAGLLYGPALFSLLVSPHSCALNHYCVTRLIADSALRPPRGLRWLSLLGVAFVASATGLTLWAALRRPRRRYQTGKWLRNQPVQYTSGSRDVSSVYNPTKKVV